MSYVFQYLLRHCYTRTKLWCLVIWRQHETFTTEHLADVFIYLFLRPLTDYVRLGLYFMCYKIFYIIITNYYHLHSKKNILQTDQ